MKLKRLIFSLILLFCLFWVNAQNKKPELKNQYIHQPSKASFYSAVIPGLGQYYNEQYWKIPIVYAAIGTSIYFMIANNGEYQSFRKAYLDRKAGKKDIYYDIYPEESTLIEAQDYYSTNFVYSILFIIGFYALNIIDANVYAHLNDYNLDYDISFDLNPSFNFEDRSFGLAFNLNF